MAAVAIILAASIGAFVLGFGEETREPAPNVAETTGEFAVAPPDENAGGNQIVRITHVAGESVNVEDIEIAVTAIGPSLDTEARLVDLPAEGGSIDEKNLEGNKGLVDESGNPSPRVIVDDDSNLWTAGDTIEFRINTGGADFRPGGDADELEVSIVHVPSNAIIFEDTFTPSGG
jgi:FlaG/FlaF family flagellin (archaellin)